MATCVSFYSAVETWLLVQCFIVLYLWAVIGFVSNRLLRYHIQKQPPELLCKKCVLRNFAIFTGKQACNFIKKETRHRCFPVNFTKFLRTPFLQNTSGRLLLKIANDNSKTTKESLWHRCFPANFAEFLRTRFL